jgi:hypothetical protein
VIPRGDKERDNQNREILTLGRLVSLQEVIFEVRPDENRKANCVNGPRNSDS